MADMTDMDDLVARVREHARSTTGRLPRPVFEKMLLCAEAALGFRLHPLLARLYREVADGGFGPDYRLMPLLAGHGATVVSTYAAERVASDRDEEPHWPSGVLPIMTWGCGMYAAVDCRSPEGTVLLFQPNGVAGDWNLAWYVDAAALSDWLETWLSGTGWYEEGMLESGKTPPNEPVPWKEAAQRLAGSGR